MQAQEEQHPEPQPQLAHVHQDVWDLALALSQPASTCEGGSHKLKPLTSITSFHSLAGLSDNEKLQLLTTLYKGDLDIGGLDAAAWKLKIHKQVKTAFLANTNMTVEEVTGLLGEDVFHKEINCWTDAFTQMGKGRSLHPVNFTHQVHTLLHTMRSQEPKVQAEAHVFQWESPTKYTIKSYLQKLGVKDDTPPVSFDSCTAPTPHLSLFWNNLALTYSGITFISSCNTQPPVWLEPHQ